MRVNLSPPWSRRSLICSWIVLALFSLNIRVQAQPAKSQTITTAVFFPDGNDVAGSSLDDLDQSWLHIFSIAQNKLTSSTALKTPEITALEFLQDKQHLAVGSVDGIIRIWNPTIQQFTAQLVGHNGSILHLQYIPNSNKLISAGKDMTIRIWDIATGEQVTYIKGASGALDDMSVAPNGKSLIGIVRTGAGFDLVQLWNLEERKLQRQLQLDSFVGGVAYSPDSSFIAIGYNSDITIWNTELTHQMRSAYTRGSFRLAISPDSKLIMVGELADEIALFDVATAKELARPFDGPDYVSGDVQVAFDPTNRYAFSLSQTNGEVKIWEGSTLRLLANFRLH